MSQNAFAARFGILPSTLRDWEQNRCHPDGATRVLLMVIDKKPDAVTQRARAG
jgi:putative transcriptional regulator